MTAELSLPSEMNSKRAVRVRTFALAICVIILVGVLTSTATSANQKSRSNDFLDTKQTGNQTLFKAANNPIPNPPATAGPSCVSKIAVLLDRSYSIVNAAQADGLADQTYANQLKAAVNTMMTTVGTRAANNGGYASVLIYAFGTTPVIQNGRQSETFATWVAGTDVSNPTNRFYQGINVNNIWFTDQNSQPYNPFLPSTAGKGYLGGANPGAGITRGSTNYHQAFVDAGNMIDLWTAPSDRDDDDFDLVLMITDGVPTSNSGNNHSIDAGEAGLLGPYSNSDLNDLIYSTYAVNQLRTGKGFVNAGVDVRPPVPVVGILAGSQASNTTAHDHMNTVFGFGNWYGANNFTTDLQARIDSATAGLNCGGVAAKTDVSPSVEIVPVVSAPDDDPLTPEIEIVEGTTISVSYTVKNTGDTSLNDVTVTAPGYSYPFGTLGIGSSFTGSYSVHVDFGGHLPPPQRVKVIGDAVWDPITNNEPTVKKPEDHEDLNFSVVRVPLPS